MIYTTMADRIKRHNGMVMRIMVMMMMMMMITSKMLLPRRYEKYANIHHTESANSRCYNDVIRASKRTSASRGLHSINRHYINSDTPTPNDE